MEPYKLCPGCGTHNNPLAIECEECGEDLSSVRILDAQTEEQINAQSESAVQSAPKQIKTVRICDDCGAKNDPQARKCAVCGEDISTVVPVPQEEEESKQYSLASTDGDFTFAIRTEGGPIVIGRENEMSEYLKNRLFVSRRHAELSFSDGKLMVKSFAATTNGTFVNGEEITPDTGIELHAGDVVGLGGNDPETQKMSAYFEVIES